MILVKKQQLAKQVRCFFFYLILLIKSGTKFDAKDIKKPLLSHSLATSDNKGLQSANADQHRDRITRFGILKHRSKQQENYLWTLAKYKENYQNDKPNEESIKATKAAQKLLTCGNFLLFKNFYTIDQVKLLNFMSVVSICFALFVQVFVHLRQFKNIRNVLMKSCLKIASSSLF
jgi:hypothetical protein